MKDLLERHCGGIRGGWSNLQAVIPGVRREEGREGREDEDEILKSMHSPLSSLPSLPPSLPPYFLNRALPSLF